MSGLGIAAAAILGPVGVFLLVAIALQVDALAARPVSHEDFTSAVAALVPGAQVTTRWNTGPWSVEVSISALPR